jgi:hypothetical protein
LFEVVAADAVDAAAAVVKTVPPTRPRCPHVVYRSSCA